MFRSFKVLIWDLSFGQGQPFEVLASKEPEADFEDLYNGVLGHFFFERGEGGKHLLGGFGENPQARQGDLDPHRRALFKRKACLRLLAAASQLPLAMSARPRI